VYPAHARQPFAAIRAERHPRAVDLTLVPGESALLLGGIIPHEVTPIASGQQRTMSVMCFRRS
jgi:hypothetical protein